MPARVRAAVRIGKANGGIDANLDAVEIGTADAPPAAIGVGSAKLEALIVPPGGASRGRLMENADASEARVTGLSITGASVDRDALR